MKRKWLIGIGAAVAAGGIATVGYGWLFGDVHTLKNIPPDEPVPPSVPPPSPEQVPEKTGYKLVDALLPKLKAVASSTGIPLGLMTAWISKESGGNLTSAPPPLKGESDSERGLYQLTPTESKALGITDHKRLSTDTDYSLDAGTKLIRKYQAAVDALGAAPKGSAFYWLLTKCVHTVGGGQTKKWVKAAQAAGKMGSWDDFSNYVLGEHWTGPQPKKWMPFLASVYRLGRPFGFGEDGPAPLVAGAPTVSGCCVYCEDGYHDLCDAKDRQGECACSCAAGGPATVTGPATVFPASEPPDRGQRLLGIDVFVTGRS